MIVIDQNKIFEKLKDSSYNSITKLFKIMLGQVFEEISKNISLISLLKVNIDKYKQSLNFVEYKR